MGHTLSLYRRLIGVQIRSQMQYRFGFAMDLISTGLITSTVFMEIALILQRFRNIGGWKLGEIAFLYGMVEFAFGTMDMLFSGFDPDGFPEQIRLGRFDQVLLRPVNPLVQVLGSKFLLRRIGRILQGAVILGLSLALTDVHWTAGKALYLPVVYLSCVAFFGGLFIIGSTITFWTVQSIEAINIFTYGGSEMMSYPMHIYGEAMRGFFTYVLPAIFLVYYPALYILGTPDPLGMPAFAPFLCPLVGWGLLGLSLLFWKFGMKHYQSTGS
jgi:ABC-2 type transport system permease protein